MAAQRTQKRFRLTWNPAIVLINITARTNSRITVRTTYHHPRDEKGRMVSSPTEMFRIAVECCYYKHIIVADTDTREYTHHRDDGIAWETSGIVGKKKFFLGRPLHSRHRVVVLVKSVFRTNRAFRIRHSDLSNSTFQRWAPSAIHLHHSQNSKRVSTAHFAPKGNENLNQ